ncbi:TDP-N-acetylfucosamine:lipid II N-acetylfucosaminyltransferase [Cyclobacterium xiamenense]|uniref:TDP-N-acetylfucosamine:lipid II N-acetylfucosaminyltransferase n=1 Tax=Cyclobacterium xiamenense TaxID=1297121 RepID=UPI0012B7152B|nr:TDP-N-acetylfucosamine:lipid II N-acetylfucosaminyltransferase [Cyclobacterium xiamenense]
MIIHILNDEKFSDWVIDAFEKVNPSKNIFLMVSDSNTSGYLDDPRIEFIPKKRFLDEVIPRESDLFIFYYLHRHSIDFLVKHRKRRFKKLWIGYGSDYYYYLLRPPYYRSLYREETEKIFNQHYRRNLVKNLGLKVYQFTYYNLWVRRAILTLDYFSPIIPNEFDMVAETHSFSNLTNVGFTFGDLDYLFADYAPTKQKSHILVNNSATYAGNHLDILKLLKKLRVAQKIILPLNYGDQNYRNHIVRYCEQHFSNQAECITEFLPRRAYFTKVTQCEFTIMGHLRQQAMGNIYALLYAGSKLFLYKDNPVYAFLRELNMSVYTIEDLEDNPSLIEIPLEHDQKERNRQIISSYYSWQASKDRIKAICSL